MKIGDIVRIESLVSSRESTFIGRVVSINNSEDDTIFQVQVLIGPSNTIGMLKTCFSIDAKPNSYGWIYESHTILS